MDLNEFELDVIRCVAGLPQDSVTSWGAAFGAALGSLKGGGFLKREMIQGVHTYSATEKGLVAVGAQDREPNSFHPPRPRVCCLRGRL